MALQNLTHAGNIFTVIGAGLLTDTSKPGVIEIGPLDERFFPYSEEADWQLRYSTLSYITITAT